MDVDPPAAPLKLTFRLGAPAASATPASSTAASPSPSASLDPDPDPAEHSYPEGAEGASPSPPASDTASFPEGITVGTAVGLLKEKPKRKRLPKRPTGEPGPGKHWRKGLKGNLAGVGLQSPLTVTHTHIPQHLPSPIPSTSHARHSSPASASGVPPPLPTTTRSFPIGPAPKIATSFLPPMALEARTPHPRRWNKVAKELTSVTGMRLAFRSWQGRSHSPYTDYRLALLAAESHSRGSPSGSPAPVLHFPASAISDPKAGAAAAAAAFRERTATDSSSGRA